MKPDKHIGARMIPIEDLCPHPLNANTMSEDLRAKLKVHIGRTGRYPFVVVRADPEEPGRFQILDGHHRVEILRELDHTEARCDIWNVDDREAKLLLATLNRLEGQDREGPHFSDRLLRWLRSAEDRRRSHEEATEIRA